MNHPDTDDLARYALDEVVGGRVQRHVETCRACSAKVRALRLGRASVVAHSSRSQERGPECLDENLIAAFVEGSADEAARAACMAHLGACSHCRSAVSSVARALSVIGVADAPMPPARRRAVRWAAPLVGLSAAAVATVIFVGRTADPVPDPTHRDATTAQAPMIISPHGPTDVVQVLRWHTLPGADRYRVTVFDELGSVVFEVSVADTVAALPANLGLVAARPYYWLVAARTAFDRWQSSALTQFSVYRAAR